MRIAIVFLLLCSLCVASTAQDYEAATVYSVDGKIKYSPEERGWFNYKTLRPGAQLSPNGRLKIKKGARVAILQDGEYALLKGKQRTTTVDVLNNPRAFQDDVYLATFEAYVKDSEHPYFRQPEVLGFVSNTEDPTTTIESGPTKPPAKESKEGHQDPNAAIVPVSPNSTSTNPAKVAGPSTTFRWVPKKGATTTPVNYQLAILDDDNKVVWEESVEGNSYAVDLSGLNLKPGAYYKWQVSLAGDPGMNTSQIPFQYVSGDEAQQLIATLQASDFHASASPTAQLLIEATTLEEEGLQAMAYDRYETAVAQDAHNELAVAMFKTFLWRYGGLD